MDRIACPVVLGKPRLRERERGKEREKEKKKRQGKRRKKEREREEKRKDERTKERKNERTKERKTDRHGHSLYRVPAQDPGKANSMVRVQWELKSKERVHQHSGDTTQCRIFGVILRTLRQKNGESAANDVGARPRLGCA